MKLILAALLILVLVPAVASASFFGYDFSNYSFTPTVTTASTPPWEGTLYYDLDGKIIIDPETGYPWGDR